MGNCCLGWFWSIWSTTAVRVPTDDVESQPAYHGYVQNASEGCQTIQPAICVQDKKKMRMLVFAKCLTLEENRHDTIRVTVYFTEEHGHDPVKEGVSMEANKDAGKLVGQSPVFIYNNQHHILVQIGDIVLPKKLVKNKSKLTSKLAFDRMWESYKGQSCTLVLRPATGREKGVYFTVTYMQREFTVDIQVVEELRKLVLDEAFSQSSDSGVSGDLDYYRVRSSSSEGDDGPEARPTTHRENKSQKSKNQKSKNQNSKSEDSVRSEVAVDLEPHDSAQYKASASSLGEPLLSDQHGTPLVHGKQTSHVAPPPSNRTVQDDETVYSGCKPRDAAQSATPRTQRPPDLRNDMPLEAMSQLSQSSQMSQMTQMLPRTNSRHSLRSIDGLSSRSISSARSFTDQGLPDDSGYAGYSGSPMVLNVGQLHLSHTHIRNESVRGYESIEHFPSDRFPEVLLAPMRPLDLGDWKMLASRLKMDRVVDSIEAEAKLHGKSPIRLLMDEWWKSEGKGAQLATVKKALEKMQRRDVLDDLEDAESEWQNDDTQS